MAIRVAPSLLVLRVFLRTRALGPIPVLDRRAAPLLALVVVGIVGLAFACYFVAYAFGLEA